VIDIARKMAAGYQSVHPLPSEHLSMLHALVCSRLAQSVTMGAYSFSINPENQYLLVTAQPGWILLRRLMTMSTEEIRSFNSDVS
jgi:hypothetical protein